MTASVNDSSDGATLTVSFAWSFLTFLLAEFSSLLALASENAYTAPATAVVSSSLLWLQRCWDESPLLRVSTYLLTALPILTATVAVTALLFVTAPLIVVGAMVAALSVSAYAVAFAVVNSTEITRATDAGRSAVAVSAVAVLLQTLSAAPVYLSVPPLFVAAISAAAVLFAYNTRLWPIMPVAAIALTTSPIVCVCWYFTAPIFAAISLGAQSAVVALIVADQMFAAGSFTRGIVRRWKHHTTHTDEGAALLTGAHSEYAYQQSADQIQAKLTNAHEFTAEMVKPQDFTQ